MFQTLFLIWPSVWHCSPLKITWASLCFSLIDYFKINQLHNPWRKNLYGVSVKAARGANLFPKTRPLSALMTKLRQHPQILEQSITAPDGFVPLVIGEKGHTFSQSSIDMYWEAGSSFWPGLFMADISTEMAGVRLISPSSTANLSVQ